MRTFNLKGPVLILPIGYPGAGKTYFSRNFAESNNFVHLQEDLIRNRLYSKPSYSKEENEHIEQVIDLMMELFLDNGKSVVLDSNLIKAKDRKAKREIANDYKARVITVWIQTDLDTAFDRASNRDRRRIDEKYARNLNKEEFNSVIESLQRPAREDYAVISGKHDYKIQQNTVYKKFEMLGYLRPASPANKTISGPQKISPKTNLGGRVDLARRADKF